MTAIEPNRRYSQRELNEMADEILREDSRGELCRECNGRGDATGIHKEETQEAVDGEGNALVVMFPEYACAQGHTWYLGEGLMRGIGGDNPILFEEHIQSRRRREIYNCVSADTECLHRTLGWVTEADVEPGDEILVFDTATGTTRWGPVTEVHRYKHSGELLRLHGQGMDCLVTENHRWPVLVMDKRRRAKGFEVVTTSRLPMKAGRRALLLGAPHEGVSEATYSDAFVRLQQLHVEPRSYKGDIWCPTTTTGFWVARRKGKTFVTGNSLGSPDPSIVSGMYNRAHPQGRKINTPEARAKHGASYYR